MKLHFKSWCMSILGHFTFRRLGWAYAKLCWVSLHSTQPTFCRCYSEMRNPTTADFQTESQKFLFRSDWPFFWPAAPAYMKLQRNDDRRMSIDEWWNRFAQSLLNRQNTLFDVRRSLVSFLWSDWPFFWPAAPARVKLQQNDEWRMTNDEWRLSIDEWWMSLSEA